MAPTAEERENREVVGWLDDGPVEGLDGAAGRGRLGATAEVRVAASCFVGDLVGD